MRVVDLIEKKKNGKSLEKNEIDFLLDEYLKSNVPDYQMSAYLMSVFFNGMTEEELAYFTLKMRDSGDVISFPDVDKFLVDKHSTGGVGDKVTVILGALLAALGMATTKLSGKGLGHTGGTIDKFESIKDFSFSNTRDELVNIVNKTGVGIMGYSDSIVPLDKKLYSLRDVTATVNSIPLIASSIMSKKLAIESNIIILDVKFGDGAFMKTVEDARELSRTMVSIGNSLGRKTVAILTSMEEPLGSEVGNANEIIEGIEALKGNWAADVKEVVYSITYLALKEKGEVETFEEASKLIDKVIEDGSALAIFQEFIKESGANPAIVNDYTLLPKPESSLEVQSTSAGYVGQIKAEEIGIAAMIIGAGRATKEDLIDHAVGITLHKKVGEYVEKGELLATIHFNDEKNVEQSKEMILDAYEIQEAPVQNKKVVLEIVE